MARFERIVSAAYFIVLSLQLNVKGPYLMTKKGVEKVKQNNLLLKINHFITYIIFLADEWLSQKINKNENPYQIKFLNIFLVLFIIIIFCNLVRNNKNLNEVMD